MTLLEPCPGVAILPGNGGFCNRTDQTSTIQDLACCGSCAKSGHRKKKISPGVIAGLTVGAVTLVAALVCLAVWLIPRDKTPIKDHPDYNSDASPDPVGTETNRQ